MNHRGFFISLIIALAISSGETIAAELLDCPSKNSSNYYFPQGTLAPQNAQIDELSRSWYSKHLHSMREPSLSCGSTGLTYRFTWLRTFHHPVVIRVVDSGRMGSLLAVELDGAGGYEPGKLIRRQESTLSKTQLLELKSLFASTSFWTLPTPKETSGMDGSEWIIEVTDNGRYHVVVRWTPTSGVARDIGMRFLHLAKWKLNDIY
jgi:hypothetical protein